MTVSREQLLKPSLSGVSVVRAPYSVQVTFLAAFFGGPVASIAITALNTFRLRRLARDLLPLALMLAVYLGFVWALSETTWGSAFLIAAQNMAGPRVNGLLLRLMALIFCGLGYLMHRGEQRSSDVMGLERPNGWIGGLVCIACGIAASLALGYFISVWENT